MRRIRVGVLSAGSWSETSHLPTLSARDEVDLVVITRPDLDQARRVAQTFGVPQYDTDWRRALELGLDAVVVSSPPAAHEEQVIAALQSGAHVLCEKPFALNSESAWRMVDAAASADRSLLVGFGWTATPVFRSARKLVADGAIGDLEYVMLHLAVNTRALLAGASDGGWAGAGASEPATYIEASMSGGGSAAVSMSHEFGMLLWLVDQPIVTITAQTFPPAARIDLHDATVVTFENGAIGSVSCASTHPHNERPQWQLQVYGSSGQLAVDSMRDLITLVRANGTIWQPEPGTDDGAYRAGAPTNELVDAALGKATSPGFGSILAARVVEITDALYLSAKDGRPADIDRRA